MEPQAQGGPPKFSPGPFVSYPRDRRLSIALSPLIFPLNLIIGAASLLGFALRYAAYWVWATREPVARILESPYAALIVTIVLGGAALSGKFSVIATRLLLFVAWMVALYDLRAQPRWLIGVIAVTFAAFLVALGIWFTPDVVPGYSGTLAAKAGTIFSSDGTSKIKTIEVGKTGTTFTIERQGKYGALIFPFLTEAQFKIENIGGKSKVSTQIADRSGNIITELRRNEWKVAPPPGTWDRNYTDDALEVINAQGKVVLQVKVLPDRLQLQGEWWAPTCALRVIVEGPACGIRLLQIPEAYNAQIQFLPPERPNAHQIRRMFEYPSDLHLGELAK